LEFDFTPIHIAVLRMYDPTDRERPSLEEYGFQNPIPLIVTHANLSRLIDLVDDANNAPANTNWAEWKLKFKGRSPLFSAVIEYFRSSAFGQPKGTKIIHNLLDQKDKKYDWTPLHWAASSGHVEEMKVLVAHGADPTILSNLNANILHAASESKTNSGLVGALEVWKRCSDRLDINQVNRWVETPLHVASWTSAACVRVLLEAGADPGLQEENGQVPLHCAGLSEQSADRRQIVSLFCTTENKAHLNTQDLDGRPPVFDFLDDSECVKLLLENGASLDLLDNEGRNVFHHVCSQGESNTLAVLLSHASNDSNPAAAKCDSGNTPLIEALSNHHVECALALLKLEDVGDTVSNEGWAPVHYAAKIGDIDLLRAVLQHSSFSKGMRTMDGKRVSDVAMEAGNWQAEFKKLIREYDYL
jgi:ankyrin repeat protein